MLRGDNALPVLNLVNMSPTGRISLRHGFCCRPATNSHVLTRSAATIHALRQTAGNGADGGKSIKRGTNFKQAEREKCHESDNITQMHAVNMQTVRQCCLKLSHVEERQNKPHSLLLVC